MKPVSRGATPPSRRAILAGFAGTAFAGLVPWTGTGARRERPAPRRTPGDRAYRTIPAGCGEFYLPDALAEVWAIRRPPRRDERG